MAHERRREKPARTIRIDDLGADHFVREYMALVDEGWSPDVDEFVSRAPERVREDAAAAIHAAIEGRTDQVAADESGVEHSEFYDIGVEVAIDETDAPVLPVGEDAESADTVTDDSSEDAADEPEADSAAQEFLEAAFQRSVGDEADDEAPTSAAVRHDVDLMELNADEAAEEHADADVELEEDPAPAPVVGDEPEAEEFCGGSCDCEQPCGDEAAVVEEAPAHAPAPTFNDPLAMFETGLRDNIDLPESSSETEQLETELDEPEMDEAEAVDRLLELARVTGATTDEDEPASDGIEVGAHEEITDGMELFDSEQPAEGIEVCEAADVSDGIEVGEAETVADDEADATLRELAAAIGAESAPLDEDVIEDQALEEEASDNEPAPSVDAEPMIPGYRIEEHLGAGRLGRTFAAWDDVHKRRVTLKLFDRTDAERIRGLVEADSHRAAELGEPAIVGFDGVAVGGDGPAFVRTCVEGVAFDEACRELSYRDVARLLRATARALVQAHAEGVVHHDLKPENILVTESHNVRIVDWGVGAINTLGETLPYFAAPEVLAGREAWTEADVFSFGAVMYSALTHGVPFYGESLDDIRKAIRTEDPLFPRAARPDVPLDLQSICLQCLARRSVERPTMFDVLEDLDRYLRGEAALARPPQYAARLHKEAMERHAEIESWTTHGVLTRDEGDDLEASYRRVLEREQQWTYDATRRTPGRWAGQVGAVAIAVGAALTAGYAASIGAGIAQTVLALALAGVAWWAYRRGDRAHGVAFALGGLVPLAAGTAILVGGGVPLAPLPLLVGGALALFASLGWWIGFGHPVFGWTAIASFTTLYAAGFAMSGWPQSGVAVAALLALPLAGLIGGAVALERRTRRAHALPLAVAGAAALLVAPWVWAWTAPVLAIEALAAILAGPALGLVAHALLLWASQLGWRRIDAPTPRRLARVLEWIVPAQIVGALAWSAWSVGTAASIGVLAVASLAVGGAGLVRRRAPFSVCGLAGVAACLIVPVLTGLAGPADLALWALIGGGVLTLGLYAFRVFSLRRA